MWSLSASGLAAGRLERSEPPSASMATRRSSRSLTRRRARRTTRLSRPPSCLKSGPATGRALQAGGHQRRACIGSLSGGQHGDVRLRIAGRSWRRGAPYT